MLLIRSGKRHSFPDWRIYLQSDKEILVTGQTVSVSARPEFLGVIDDPLFENLGVIGKFRGSELF